MTTEIVGREDQLAEVERFAARLEQGPAALVLHGEPGIGKSTVWRRAVEALREGGAVVLDCRPAEAEVRFPFAALRDLLAPLVDDFKGLPTPMARALRVALLLEEPGVHPVESGTVEAATLRLLRDVARQHPVVIAIDDVQWLDETSRVAIAFIARRARDERFGFLLAERVEGLAARLEWLSDAFPADRTIDAAMPPLSVGAVHRLLRTRLQLSLPRPNLLRLHELSRGNPFYALEIGASWQAGVAPDGGGLPETLRTLVARKLRALPAATRRVLLAAAVASGEDVDVDRLASIVAGGATETRRHVEAAVAAGILVPGHGVRFSHPLLAAAAIEEASPHDVRRAHERAAEVAGMPEARARHLAAARTAPDDAVAQALDEAAERAATRGAAADAAELRDLAVRFSRYEDQELVRRTVAQGEARFIAGDLAGARTTLESAVALGVTGELGVAALLLLATLIWYDESSAAAVPVAEAALRMAAGRRDLLAQVHARMAWLCDNDIPRGQRHAAAALDLLDPAEEPALYAFALLNEAYLRLLLGVAADSAAIERGFELQEEARIWEFSTLAGNWPKLLDQFDTARTRLELYLERVRAQGDESSIAQIAGYLAELECWTGRLGRAGAYANEAIELAEETGQGAFLIQGLRHRAVIEIVGGTVADARPDAERALELARAGNDPVLVAGAAATRAIVALTDGDAALVDAMCLLAVHELDGIGMRDHAPYRFQPDHIEAVVALGDLDRAAALLERHAARGAMGPRPWIQATAARCEALIAAARGDVAGAANALARARQHHADLDMPFELGRTLLVEGQVMRRSNHRREAVAALTEAVAIFERLGSREWATRANAELGRVGIRRGSGDSLTPTELRVAGLAASGMTNRQVAAELFISPKTVEANLSRAYSKLGVGSRAELGAVMASRGSGSGLGGEPGET